LSRGQRKVNDASTGLGQIDDRSNNLFCAAALARRGTTRKEQPLVNHPELTYAHMAMRLEEAKSFRVAHTLRRQERASSARPTVAWRLHRVGRKAVPAAVTS